MLFEGYATVPKLIFLPHLIATNYMYTGFFIIYQSASNCPVGDSAIGTLRSMDDDGRENVAEKVNSRSFNLHQDFSKSLTL